MKANFLAVCRSILFVLIGLMLGGLVAGAAGENPLNVFRIIFFGVTATPYDFGLTLYYATILLLSGLATAVPFQAGVFNIGGEGQIIMGAFASAICALLIGPTVGEFFSPALALVFSFVGGALWGAIAGWIRAYRGGHEVISSIMLNFVAAGLTGWVILDYFKALDSQNPETPELLEMWLWDKFDVFAGAPVTSISLVALGAALVVYIVFAKTTFGYSIKATRLAPRAAQVAGIETKQVRFWALTLGGGFGGAAGGLMVLASTGRFHLDMAEGFGFMGIPVALAAKGHPIGVVFAALLFGVLHHGSSALDLESALVTRDLALVIQALVMIAVVCESLLTKSWWSQLRAAAKRGR